jgi:hypothetical protein
MSSPASYLVHAAMGDHVRLVAARRGVDVHHIQVPAPADDVEEEHAEAVDVALLRGAQLETHLRASCA